MKRILSLALIVLLLPALLAVPAMADEVNQYSYNLLDYSFPNNGTEYKVTVNDGDIVNFSMPIPSVIAYVDIVFYSAGNIPSNIVLNHGSSSATLTIKQIQGRTYRAYGHITQSTDSDLDLVFTVPGTAYITFYSFNISTQGVIATELDVLATITDYAYSPANTHTLDFTGTAVTASWDNLQASATHRAYRSELIIIDWQAYDYVDLLISTVSVGVQSVNVLMGGVSGYGVPFTVSYVDSVSDYQSTLTTMCIKIDLTELSKGPSTLMVQVTAREDSNGYSSFSIQSCTGLAQQSEVSPWLVWFNRLDGWIKAQTSSISSSIATWGKNIVEALGGSNDASQVQNDINAAVGELQQAGAALDAVERPDIGHVNIDVAGMVDPVGLTGVAAIVGLFTGNSLIYSIMLMFVTLALISYILYGKG